MLIELLNIVNGIKEGKFHSTIKLVIYEKYHVWITHDYRFVYILSLQMKYFKYIEILKSPFSKLRIQRILYNTKRNLSNHIRI